MNKEELFREVDEALNSVRPHLMVDGGDVEVVEITDDLKVKVKWLGNCQQCTMSAMTMKAGIERAIISKVPSIVEVVAINGLDVA
ncbi:NifU family protein [Membranihabitans marinus]|uniref:NifU family protein n=1 Tax=Membranihabitans marinus TaxID=1227546 RepID=UPI001F2A9F08|nr:NifU family protein [Membranihabitans marinus]